MQHIFYYFIITFFCMILIIPFSHAEKCTQILFYNSDTNINNYKQLKIEFDTFFNKIGNYTFQPFDDEKIFQNQLNEKKFCMIIVSSWFLNNLQNNLELVPALIAHKKGVDKKQIVLITKITSDPKKTPVIKTGNVATSMSSRHTKAVLDSILSDNNLNVLRVPKDIDALMAVGFGIATYALSTFNSFKTLSVINPALYKKLTLVGKKITSPMMICAFLGQQQHKKLIDAFVNIDKIPEGKNSIKMLGIDGFKYYQKEKNSDVETLGPTSLQKKKGLEKHIFVFQIKSSFSLCQFINQAHTF